jgi:hypothetical protein
MPRRHTPEQRTEAEATRAKLLAHQRVLKAAHREDNRQRWADSPENAAVRHAEEKAALVEEIAQPAPADVRSVDQLTAIYRSDAVAIGRRVDAAAIVMSFQVPAAGLATGGPVLSDAYDFLKRVSITSAAPEAVRFAALKSLSTVESARPRAADPDASAEHLAMMRQWVNSTRRLALIEAGAWEQVQRDGIDWRLRSSDVFSLPVWPAASSRQPATASYGAVLDAFKALPAHEQQRQHAARRAALLAVRAQNRPDKDWRRLLDAAPIEG